MTKRLELQCGDHSHSIKKDGTSVMPLCLINRLFTKKGEHPYIEVGHIPCKGAAFYTRKFNDNINILSKTKKLNGETPEANTIMKCGTCNKMIRAGEMYIHTQIDI